MTTRLCPGSRPLLFLIVAIAVLGGTTLPSAGFAVCGDAIIEAGEDCDDGNGLDGDCCSSACLYESVGSVCADDGEFCTRDQCDGAGVCGHDGTPFDSCSVAPKGKLRFTNDANDEKDRLTLQMKNSPGTAPEDFGDPLATDTYHVCIFGPDSLLMEAEVGPGGTCYGKSCWARNITGFTFKDPGGTRDGITAFYLKANAKPKTKITVRGRGVSLDDVTLPFPDKVMAQIVNQQTGRCFETHFLDPSTVKTNTTEKYDAKAAAPGAAIPGLAKVIRQDDLAIGAPLANLNANTAQEGGARTGPDPTQVYVQSITSSGFGCPPGTIVQSFSDDRSAFTLTLDQYEASKGPGIPISQAHQSCRLDLDLKIPQGWQYSIATIEYRGFVSLPEMMEATQQSTYYFEGDGTLAYAHTAVLGPVTKDYLIRDTLPFTTAVWSSCNKVRPLIISTQLDLTGGTDLGTISTVGVDGSVEFVVALHWKPC